MLDQRDIQQLNRLYLLVAQRLAAQDPELASHVTGVSKQVLSRMASLSLTEMDEIYADIRFLLFKPRLTDSNLLKLLELPAGAKGSYISANLAKGVERETN